MEVEVDNELAKDHPERKKFEDLRAKMEKGGTDCSKLRLRFYSENHRGVHAACNIKEDETILKIPFE